MRSEGKGLPAKGDGHMGGGENIQAVTCSHSQKETTAPSGSRTQPKWDREKHMLVRDFKDW